MSRRGLKVKDSDVFKAVKENNRNKFLVRNLSLQFAQLLQVGHKAVYGHDAPSGGILQTCIF